jgi:hypothetical protein
VKTEQPAAVDRVMTAAQRFARAMEETEHWRVADAYPHTRWKAAWDERMAAMSALHVAAERLATRPTQPLELRKAPL